MAAQAETTVNVFHSLDRDMALQSEERFRRAQTLSRNNNLALQAFASFESLSGDAIESFAAEIFRDAFNRLPFSPQQMHGPMQWYPRAFAAITREGHGASLANPSWNGRGWLYFRTIEQSSYGISQSVRSDRPLKKGALAGHGLYVSQFTWGCIAEKKSAYLRANELKPSEEFAKAVTVQNSLRQYEVDRSLVLAADAPSLTSAIGFQHRVAKGTEDHGQGH
jgi:hypothetical protein